MEFSKATATSRDSTNGGTRKCPRPPAPGADKTVTKLLPPAAQEETLQSIWTDVYLTLYWCAEWEDILPRVCIYFFYGLVSARVTDLNRLHCVLSVKNIFKLFRSGHFRMSRTSMKTFPSAICGRISAWGLHSWLVHEVLKSNPRPPFPPTHTKTA